MGMCSRQERIQKDIDVVIQKCKAEKDCLFADFRYSDSTFTFTYIGGSKSVSYSVHVSEDYPGIICQLGQGEKTWFTSFLRPG
uniref:Poly(ADP-ribose) polymerase family member 8 n=1 Tax=Dromaius novaehollandiae TaxID=8790 RepID=A0A8C4JF83_DRONO